jgi:predicted nucleotidyltransferase
MTTYERLFGKLNRANVRYLVVGGLAVVLHGVARLTADIDLIVDLAPSEAARVITVLEQHGLRPRPPVSAADFADPEIRAEWIRSKGMQVFTMYDPDDPLITVDLFVESPVPFEELWDRSVEFELPTTYVRVVSVADLIRLKRAAGRPLDVTDIEALQALQQDGGDDES